ncbi:MAG: universal stress protein [Bacteroidales bacterium]|nr:universal stress protein [Bacteroidales bacterium]
MKQILIPIDFERQSLLAVEQSYNLARLIHAEITLLYVHEQSGIFSGFFSSEMNKDILYKIEERLQELAAKVSIQTGLKVKTMMETGRIYSRILEISKDIKADFIFMGTHSEEAGEADTARIGANSSRVIRSSKCPVITINGKHHYNGCRNILLPLDLSKETRQKVTMAIELARLFGSGIRVVSALWSKKDDNIIMKLNQQILQVRNFIDEAGIECSAEIIESQDGERTLVPTILSYARRQEDIDLIVIMTQQEIGFVEFFVGSHAQEFLRLSEIPVLSMVPKELGFTSIFS